MPPPVGSVAAQRIEHQQREARERPAHVSFTAFVFAAVAEA
jgi:hypothetical protein